VNPQVILGINDSHDASACIVINGKLVAAISEERIQRVKNMGGFPKNAIEQCMKLAGITKSEISAVAVGNIHVSCENLYNFVPTLSIEEQYLVEEKYWKPTIYENKQIKIRDILPNYKPKGILYYPLSSIPFAFNRELDQETIDSLAQMRRQFIAEFFGLSEDKIFFMDHHTCHAYYAYYAQPKRDAMMVITADAGGDKTYESIHVFNSTTHECVYRGYTNIIAKIYSYITLLLGMRRHEHEYKVMGLAPYAKEHEKRKPREVFMDCLSVDGLSFQRNPAMKDFFTYFQQQLKGCRFDGIAGGLQDFAEELMCTWVKNAISHTGIHDISLSGGLALNIKVNKRIAELSEVHSLFVPPGPGDESLSIGACYALIKQLDPAAHIAPLQHAYLGNTPTADECGALLNHPLMKKHYTASKASPHDVAALLANGEICAIIDGAMEFGPRALGHRSIIADPSSPDTVRLINSAIKMRDFWMPFTPSILSERINDYIVIPKEIDCSYMTTSFETTELGKKHLAAAIHAGDSTARPQRVEKSSGAYYDIIKAFEQITGIGAVLNTSLNIHGKPIVMHPVEIAEEIVAESTLDNIYVNGTLLRRIK